MLGSNQMGMFPWLIKVRL